MTFGMSMLRGEMIERLGSVLSARAEVLEAYLFGSAARGEATAHSDLDVAVYVDPSRAAASPYGYQADLTTDLMRAAGSNRIDLVVLNHAPPLLYHRVLRDGVRLVARDLTETTTREGRALSRYCDYVPQLKKIDAALARRIRAGVFGS
jgi:predicted nucleotidyltransferase